MTKTLSAEGEADDGEEIQVAARCESRGSAAEAQEVDRRRVQIEMQIAELEPMRSER